MKKTYLYLVSLVSLIIIIIGATMLVNMGLKSVLGVKQYVNYPQMCAAQPSTPNGDKNVVCDPEYQKEQAAADLENQKNSKKQDIAQALAFLIVSIPIFWYHWSLARKEA
ncbi:MAG: hypothetical protein JWO40_615 [Candidatus Doudnabacteria bacterium]|nr:hypothetical protein [Candidatus Doudnabacteria bacterium]